MHATRARLPQKRTAKKSPAKKAPAKKAARKTIEQAAAPALPEGVVSLAIHRAQPRHAPAGVEIYALVEWIAPAKDCWRRGELEVRRSACMPVLATRQADGALALTELPGQGDALRLERAAVEALVSGAATCQQLALPGLRVTLTAEDILPAIPAPREPARILAFPARAR